MNSHFYNAAFRSKLLAAALPQVVKPSVSLYTRLGRPKVGPDLEAKEKFIPPPEVQMPFANTQFVSRLGYTCIYYLICESAIKQSLPFSQKPATGPYPEPDEFSLHPPNQFPQHIF